MFNNELKALAEKYGLERRWNIAHGYIHGCFATIHQTGDHVTVRIYIGALDAVPENSGLKPVTLQYAEQVKYLLDPINAMVSLGETLVPRTEIFMGGSVVQVYFPLAELQDGSMAAFMDAEFPKIPALTSPLQCIHCGGHTRSEGVRVRFDRDTVVPMHTACFEDCLRRCDGARKAVFADEKAHRTNLREGVIGAALGALLAMVCWMLLYFTLWLAPLLAAGTLFLTHQGYRLMKGPMDRVWVFAVSIASAVASVSGVLLDSLITLHNRYTAYGTVVSQMMRESVFLRIELGTQLLRRGAYIGMGISLVVVTLAAFWMYQRYNSQHQQLPSRPQKMKGQA